MGDVATITRGERFTAADYVKSDGIPCIHYGEIYTDYGTVATKTISQVKPSLRSSLRYAKPGDVIVATTSENVEDVCKAVAWIGNSLVAYHDDSFALTFSGDPVFLVSFFETSGFYTQKSSVAHGVKVMRVSSDSLADINLPTPLVVEQRLIGSYFSRLDSLITLHQRERRRGYFNQLFVWEQRKLGEFGSVAMCKRIYKEQTSEQGDVPFFKIGTFGADPDAFISNELFEDFKHTYPYPAPGTLLISAAGSIGRVVEYQGEKAYFQDSNIVWLEHDHRLNDAFLKPLYSQIEWGLEGSTIKRLYNKDLLSAEVTIPDDREQKEIGQFFAKLDNLITLHQ